MTYANLSGQSGIKAFRIYFKWGENGQRYPESVVVEFNDGMHYLYEKS